MTAALICLGVLVAVLVSTPLSAVLSWCGPVDRPRERGMHTAPTPTAGGLAMVGGAAAGLLLSLWSTRLGPVESHALAAIVGVAALLGLFGGLDDVLDLSPRLKLAAQVILALAFALIAPPLTHITLMGGFALDLPAWAAVLGAALWIVVVLNAVNFMDGANGLVAGSMAIIFVGLGLRLLGADIGAFAAVLLCAAGGALGFLPLNFPKAQLFQGDAGALFLGGIAATSWVVFGHSTWLIPGANLLAMPIVLTPFLTDVFLTLIVRARRRERLLEAHKDHLYQRWLAAHGGDHPALARRVWAIVAIYTLVAAFVMIGSPSIATLAFALGLMVSIAGWLWIDRGLRRES